MHKIEFKDNDSEALGLITLSIGRRQKAEEQLDIYSPPYMDGELVEHTGKYKPYERNIEFLVTDENQISILNKWLDGYGKLTTFKDPGGYFKAHVIGQVNYDELVRIREKVTVNFKINPPFFYLDSGDVPIVMTSPGTINNPGTHTSDPYIRIIGSGNITVTINGRKMNFTNVETFIDIDTEVLPPIYKNNENQGHKMVGDLPYFDVGANAITWTGAVTELNILPRWREL